MIIIEEKISLTAENIITTTKTISQKYKEVLGKRALSETRIELIVEELLINCKASAGEGSECVVLLKKEFGNIHIELITHGAEFDPNEKEGELYDCDGFSNRILQQFNVVPKYEHSNKNGGTNKVSLNLEKKPIKNVFIYLMLIALALAVAFYYALNGIFGESAINMVSGVTVPLFNKLTSVVAAIATPLVFFSVFTGIMGLADANTLGKIGKKTLAEMMITYALSGSLLLILSSVFCLSGGTASQSGNALEQITTLVLDMIPSNLVKPFLEENDLQVITFAIFCGFVYLLIKKSLPTVGKACFELSAFFNKMMSIVTKILPLIVFLGIFNMFVSDSFSEIQNIYKMILLFLGTSLIITIVLTIRSSIITKTPIKTIVKKQISTFLIVLTTSSQVSAIPEHMNCLKNKFGIDKDFVDFALPLCVVTFMPCGAAFIGFTLIASCELAGIAVTIPFLIKLVVICIIIAIAAPPIPGSALVVMPICFIACGIPNDVYPVAIVIGVIVGYFLPAFNCYCLQHKILITGYRLGKVDMNVLRSENQ